MKGRFDQGGVSRLQDEGTLKEVETCINNLLDAVLPDHGRSLTSSSTGFVPDNAAVELGRGMPPEMSREPLSTIVSAGVAAELQASSAAADSASQPSEGRAVFDAAGVLSSLSIAVKDTPI